MTDTVLSVLAIVLGYLFGAIPFAYLVVRWRKGIDIRTVGSGNVGATNAGRVLGFRYFLLCFGLDVAKGFLPTWGLPLVVGDLADSTSAIPGLAVFVALATILGHNFPVYLGFRGGKGVATSLGALSALDPVASLATLVAFVVFLLVTRYVSMSSVLGAVVFAIVHFARVAQPWSRSEWPLSAVVVLLLVMLVVRHRGNFQRIAAGTEPKVRIGRRGAPRGSSASPAGDGPPRVAEDQPEPS